MKKHLLSGAVIAAAVASMFASSAAAHPNHAKEKSKGVKCAGINACKGRGECGGADSSCRGLNDCKGQSWITVATRKQCADRGGKVVTSTSHRPSGPARP